ncbi:Shikimate kinase 1 [Kingella potus]|uniref:Shikimate kinase n=1 Tax=Kingella potus TaxID=265175 RepID=A0A377R099_9NEIS|nr:shikimate kinase [Kingella potus]STR00933.1 Shikimate kinase 1 [Kingella potus]
MNTAKNNIFLIGLMGAGKTTLGRRLAAQLGRTFYDSDQTICERTGVSVPTIFEMEGEEGFRVREAAVIDEITARSGIVLATGGGAVLREENRLRLRARGTVVYLHAAPEILLERTRSDRNRPLLQVADPLDKLRSLYQTRDPIYRAAADFVVEAGKSDCRKTLARILQCLQD